MSTPFIEPLKHTLRRLADAHHLYACVDLASAPDAFERLVRPASSRALCLFEGALTDGAERASPWLVPLPPMEKDLDLWVSCDIAEKVAAVTWLISPLSTEALRERLGRRLDVKLGDGTELLLRFFDPRILDELDAQLESNNREAFFALGGQWCWLDRDGTLQQRTMREAIESDPMHPPLRLTPVEESALVLATEAGQVLTQALSQCSEDLMRIGGTQRIRLAKRACSEAAALKLNGVADQVQLLMLAAAHGTDYFESLRWAPHAERIRLNPAVLPALLTEAPRANG